MDQETKDYIDKTKEEIFDKLGNRYQKLVTGIELEIELIKKELGMTAKQ